MPSNNTPGWGGDMSKPGHRCYFIDVFVFIALFSALCGGAFSQGNYPVRPVQVIIAWAPGGNIDVMARHLLTSMSAQLGQQFVAINRDGAIGTIGTAQVAIAKPDGYILGAGPTTPISIGPHLIPEVKYRVESFDYICQSFENVFTIAVPAASPYRTIQDLIAAARAAPGKISYGHTGIGSTQHLSIENFAYLSGIKFNGVPYRGGAGFLVDMMAGRVDFAGAAIAQLIGRNVRVLAVFADNRHPAFPDAPTFSELGMPSMPAGLNGLFAPKGTPPEILARLERACEVATKSESFRAAAEKLYQPVAFRKGAEFADITRTDFRYKGELIRALGIRAE
jgi:tripartite-type tricarboxylate transporter receptor subunit TctC